MTGFIGEYEATLDPKGRFLLPGGLKKQFPEGENTQFVINRGFESCLVLYTRKDWDIVFSEIIGKSDFEGNNRQFKRLFASSVILAELDAAGRLLLPQNLREYAGMSKDIVLSALGDKIEIWDKNKYQAQLFESFSPEAYSKLAKEVMSKKDNEVQS